MRTTVEIRDEHRAKLLEMAARRGKKGFSSIVSEAIELLIAAQAELDAARKQALELQGTLNEEEAAELRVATSQLRSEWR
jgi:predicted CopG family antitoxin